MGYLSEDVVIFYDAMCMYCDPYHVICRYVFINYHVISNSDIRYVSISAL